MKRIDDSKLYFWSGIVTAALCVILILISFYSILFVEPKVNALLSSAEISSMNYKKAYLILRDPQIFAGYENFDSEGIDWKKTISFFDGLVYSGGDMEASHKQYLEAFLDRRKKGSTLGRNTAVFFLILSVMSWAAYLYEKKSLHEEENTGN